jgi:hypothetical protein
MLVDLKITDYCRLGCKFCYQDSTPDGQHASLQNVRHVLRQLSDMQVFEVAIGGGEPTEHPHFVEILKNARNYGIVPNFTTRSLEWLNHPDIRNDVVKYAGGIAYSGNAHCNIGDFAKRLNRGNLHIHIVLGTLDQYQYTGRLEIAKELNLGVTLLGFKTDGRGADYEPQNYSWWLSAYKALGRKAPRISIDTALATQYQDELKAAGIPEWMYQITEGRFSMYIDAVSGTCAKSSYGDSEPVSYGYNDLPKIWLGWQNETI